VRAEARDVPGRRAPANDAGRGRQANSPSEIPARGWWAILKRTANQVSEDRVMTEAAGITFYTLLALFPAIAALISIYGFFADPAAVAGHLSAVSGIVPGGGMQIIEEQVQRIASQGRTSLGFGALIALGISLWSANQAMKALVDALNVVYEEPERRGFVLRTLVTLGFTITGILFVLLAMAGVVVLPVVLGFLGLEGTTDLLLRLARWPVLALVIMLMLAAIYRYGPSREKAQWRWVTWGSGVATVGWLAGSIGFSWYVTNFGSFNETYGSLGAVIGFMTWIWLSGIVVLVGAELDAEMEHQTAQDTTTQPARPMGQRGAHMADTVA
jgi:membrane protein